MHERLSIDKPPFIRIDGRLEGYPAARVPCPFENMMRCAFMYSVCCQMSASFRDQFAAQSESILKDCSSINCMSLRFHDMFRGVTQLRSLQRSRVDALCAGFSAARAAQLKRLFARPCTLDIQEVEGVACEMSRGAATHRVRSTPIREARDWPSIPPVESSQDREHQEINLNEEVVARAVLMSEISQIEIEAWDLSSIIFLLITPNEMELFGGDNVHDWHRWCTVASDAWDMVHPNIRNMLIEKVRTLL